MESPLKVTRKDDAKIGDLMEALRKKLEARLVLCAIYLAKNGKVTVVTYPGMDIETAERCAKAVAEAIGNIQIIDLDAQQN